MRFLSKYRNYHLLLRNETYQLVEQSGGAPKLVALQPMYSADFQHGDVSEAERTFAIERFGAAAFKGTTIEGDGVTQEDPRNRISSFDTEAQGWPYDLREEFEAYMLASPSLGIDFVLYEPALVAAPWPSYDQLTAQGRRTVEMVAEKIALNVIENGYDPATVAAYETAHLKRPAVLHALAALTEPAVAVPDEPLITA